MRPIDLRHEPHQYLFHFDGVGLRRETEADRQSTHVRVDDDALVAVTRVSQDDVRCFAPDAGKRDQCAIVHGTTATKGARPSPLAMPMRLRALERKKPVLRMMVSSSCGSAAARAPHRDTGQTMRVSRD